MNMPRIPHVSTRQVVTALGVSALVVGAAIVNPGGTVSQTSSSAELVAKLEAIRDDLVTIDAATADALSRVDALIAANTTTTHPTTTTTTPTTTTRPTQTTTTRPGPTTTAAPTTTTTSPPVVLPPTIPIPQQFDGFTVNLHGKLEGCTNQDQPGCAELFYWDAHYQYQTPYTDGDHGWWDGDRQGYGCLYTPLQSDGEMIGGVMFFKIEPPRGTPGFYGIVKDENMHESESGLGRYFNGLPAPGRLIDECDPPDVDYAGLVAGPDERPRIGYLNGIDEVIEIRDYSRTVALDGVVFNVGEVLMESSTIAVASGTYTLNQLVPVYAFYQGVPQIGVYYYSFGSGNLVFEP